MTTHAPLRSRRTKAQSVYHVRGLGDGDSPTSPLKDTRLEAVRFRGKAPVTRRPPHRSGRAGFPHPVPREPPAAANGAPSRRHPAWRLPLLSRPLLDVVHDPGLRKRQCCDGRHPHTSASVGGPGGCVCSARSATPARDARSPLRAFCHGHGDPHIGQSHAVSDRTSETARAMAHGGCHDTLARSLAYTGAAVSRPSCA